MIIKDQRYSIGLEFCGEEKPKHVLRFCGDWINKFDTREAAEVGAVAHAEERGHNHTGWLLVARCGHVIWLRRGNKHRVAYGADVKDYRDVIKAAHRFGECVAHEAQCDGKLDGVEA